MKSLASILVVALSLAGLAKAMDERTSRRSQGGEDGLTRDEFRRFAQVLPELRGRIQNVAFLHNKSAAFPGGIVLLTYEEKSGWQISLFQRQADQGFQLEWVSGKLEETFSTSSERALRVVNFGPEDGVTFQGCVSHLCSDVFSILLYVPSKRTVFKAHYVHGEKKYSPELLRPENRMYKEWLDREISDSTKSNP